MTHPYHTCYRCSKTLDDFPSHLCADCRKAILDQNEQDPEGAIERLAARLTFNDLKMLDGMKIRIDADMIKAE
jgi:hypothetical protein